MNTETSYLGLKLKNPLIVGSCGLTNSVENIKELANNGAAAIVLKSIFEEEILMEYYATVKNADSEELKYLDYYDYKIKQNNVQKYIELIKDTKKAVDIPVIASINCTSSHEWTYFTKKIEEAGADALELNIFMMPYLRDKTGTDNEKIYFDIIEKVKSQVKIPVSLKMSHYFSNLGRFIERLSEKVDALVLFNRFYSPDFDIDNEKLYAGHIYSSKFEMHIPLRWIAMTHGHVHSDIAASTGIHSGADVIKMLLAGADATEIVTTIYQHGPAKIKSMLVELENYMKKHNYNSINDFKGKLSLKKSDNPSAFYRVQFMKYSDFEK
ncbi:MAG: dihydroorotate dehydrogenase-like protein [Chlorobi bacterium]|nr:dihydroorotate dehydrogenase-like protein [Chlorobiota bacterium]